MTHKFFLNTYQGSEHAMGHMNIWLSDCVLVRDDSRSFRNALQEGDIVLCETQPRQGGVYTIGIAKVEAFASDDRTPLRLEHLAGAPITPTGQERIVDHREGHTKGCACGLA